MPPFLLAETTGSLHLSIKDRVCKTRIRWRTKSFGNAIRRDQSHSIGPWRLDCSQQSARKERGKKIKSSAPFSPLASKSRVGEENRPPSSENSLRVQTWMYTGQLRRNIYRVCILLQKQSAVVPKKISNYTKCAVLTLNTSVLIIVLEHCTRGKTSTWSLNRESRCNTALCQPHFLVAVWHLLPLAAPSSACNVQNNPSGDLSKTAFLISCSKPHHTLMRLLASRNRMLGKDLSTPWPSLEKVRLVKWWCGNWLRFWFLNGATGWSWLSTVTVWTNQSFGVPVMQLSFKSGKGALSVCLTGCECTLKECLSSLNKHLYLFIFFKYVKIIIDALVIHVRQ